MHIIIIINSMTFSLHQGGVVMPSQITHTQPCRYTPLPIYKPHIDYKYYIIVIDFSNNELRTENLPLS